MPEVEKVKEVVVEEITVPVVVSRELPLDIRRFGESYSPELGELFGAMSKAQGIMTNGIKDAQAYRYKYMELGQLIGISRAPLAENGLCVMQSHELIVRKAKPAVVTHSVVGHVSGQWFRSSIEVPITHMDNLNQAQMEGVAATYGRRYALQALCNIASEADTDGESTIPIVKT